MNSKKIDPIRAWEIHRAISMYFWRNYNAPKYNLHLSKKQITKAAFDKNPANYRYAKLARKYTQEEYITIILENERRGSTFIRDIVTDGVLADFNRYFDSVYRSFEKDLKKAAKGYSYLEFRNRVLSAEESGLSFYTQMLLNLTTDGTLATEYLRNLNDPLEVHRERIGILNKYTTLFGNYVRQDIDRKKLARIVISLFTFDES